MFWQLRNSPGAHQIILLKNIAKTNNDLLNTYVLGTFEHFCVKVRDLVMRVFDQFIFYIQKKMSGIKKYNWMEVGN